MSLIGRNGVFVNIGFPSLTTVHRSGKSMRTFFLSIIGSWRGQPGDATRLGLKAQFE